MYFQEEIFENDLDEILHNSDVQSFMDGLFKLSIHRVQAFSGTTTTNIIFIEFMRERRGLVKVFAYLLSVHYLPTLLILIYHTI
jgi:hypothetical protein